jgi:hypothetical protein
LAIRAVANRGLLRVRFAFDPDVAAVARAVEQKAEPELPKHSGVAGGVSALVKKY